MGVDIEAISRAKYVACRGDEECDEKHYGVGSYPKRRDGLKPGCYVVGKGGRSMGFGAGTYVGYNDWKRQLSRMALGVEPEEVWDAPRRFRGKPFVELIDFPDGVGPIIGPKTSAKLYADFVAFASKARKHYLKRPVHEPLSSERAKPPPIDIVTGGSRTSHVLSHARSGILTKLACRQRRKWPGLWAAQSWVLVKARTWPGCGKSTAISGAPSDSPATAAL